MDKKKNQKRGNQGLSKKFKRKVLPLIGIKRERNELVASLERGVEALLSSIRLMSR